MAGPRFGKGPLGEFTVNASKAKKGVDAQMLVEAVQKTTVTSAEVLALFATPIEIAPAPGAGFANIFRRAGIYKAAGTAYAGVAAGENLVIAYTDASGLVVSPEVNTTGFVDQTTAQFRWVEKRSVAIAVVGDLDPTANANLVIKLEDAEIITGTSDLIVWCYYDVVPVVLTVPS
jgi:hypothetical protein